MPDRFEEWLRMPMAGDLGNERFLVRRAEPEEFEFLYALVDETFRRPRPRAQFDWLYRDNPYGMARCWVVDERHTGRLVSTSAHVPWPLARGDEAVWGLQVCDAAVLPEFQRLGITAMRIECQERHPQYSGEIRLAWPNDRTQGSKRKQGRGNEILGPLREGCFPLSPRTRWLRGPLARFGGAGRRPAANTGTDLRVEEVRRFGSDFDRVTHDCMAWPGFWSPHAAEFLNWRYFDQPVDRHQGWAVYEGPERVAYCVVRTRNDEALLMEFAAPERMEVVRLLLEAAKEAAARRGCRRLSFYSTPSWPHWKTFEECGFRDEPAHRCMVVIAPGTPEAWVLDRWRVVPGDQDAP